MEKEGWTEMQQGSDAQVLTVLQHCLLTIIFQSYFKIIIGFGEKITF